MPFVAGAYTTFQGKVYKKGAVLPDEAKNIAVAIFVPEKGESKSVSKKSSEIPKVKKKSRRGRPRKSSS